MQAFPGMTPAQVWDLPFVEWLIVALGAQRWAEQQREQAKGVPRGV